MPNASPPTVSATQVLKSVLVTNEPNRIVRVELCSNSKGRFARIIEERNGKANWACIGLDDLPVLKHALETITT